MLKDTKQSAKIRQIAATLFAEKGFNGVGVAELGEATGLGRGALYHHIDTKENLLYDISSRYIVELVEAGREITANQIDPAERVKSLSRHLMHVISMHLAEMTVCFREIHSLTGERYQSVANLHAEYQQIWEDAFAAGTAQGQFRKIDKTAVKGLLGMFFYSFLWLKPGGRQSDEEIGNIFSDLVLRAIGAHEYLEENQFFE
ncbi:TetR/AcrR family transcriptional regulator [Vibrio penaeicida]|uniref:TetR/AcrR family transcriptional regulator n=1 Tax=Vibrio penaeicida TaxID=104609 RepID=UPI000F819B9C|nr:TetR/AcrR family transcriptional regulator [Vibrio penaeicida]RTZ21820.1 TetR/AcrR family transcriptional regulator [Vibrio penaeicida]